MLYYSTNPTVTTVCSLQQKVERIATKVASTSEFSAARREYYNNKYYGYTSFKDDVSDMVEHELRMTGDRAKKLARLHNEVVKCIMREYVG